MVNEIRFTGMPSLTQMVDAWGEDFCKAAVSGTFNTFDLITAEGMCYVLIGDVVSRDDTGFHVSREHTHASVSLRPSGMG